MNIHRFTKKVQEASLTAQHTAANSGHPQIEPECLLAALVEQHEEIVPARLQKLVTDPKRVGEAAWTALDQLPKTEGGARSLKRAIQRLVLDPIAMQILQGKFLEGDHVVADRHASEVTFARREPVGA